MTVSLPEKVVAIDGALERAKIPHAFGGALALAYYAEPRATIDIDVNVFVTTERSDDVREAVEPLGVVAGDEAALKRKGQSRWRWAETPVDLFFDNEPIHDAMRGAVRRVPFGEDRIPILGPEHLLVCKLAFDRPKDWIDIEQMLVTVSDLDESEIRRWVDRLLTKDDPRRARLDELVARRR
jgi:Nucleotidyl transferase AbiEii toxin, Type IV TA system